MVHARKDLVISIIFFGEEGEMLWDRESLN